MRFKLRQMEVFRAVMLTGSINAAAKMLYVSQPAVSKLVAHTETTLGLRLFERAKGRLIPTAEAQALFREVEQVYQSALRVDEFARALALGPASLLRVACSPSLATAIVAPAIVELDRARELKEEVFGPVLHVMRWRPDELDQLCDDIAANGTALTLSIHTRIDATVARILARLSHGNVYVNRNMIGAVVGSQPFGGSGLSGTGPKTGGPHYLIRFALEQVVTVNTAASGGDATLLSDEET